MHLETVYSPKRSEWSSSLENTNDIVAPSQATEIPSIRAISNVLCVRGTRHTHDERKSSSSLFVAFADRSLSEISPSPPHQRFTDVASLHNGPILCIYPLPHGRALTTSMSGELILHGPRSYSGSTDVEILARRRDHLKYVVQTSATHDTGSRWIIATAGWDQKVHVYSPLDLDPRRPQLPTPPELLGAPAATISLPSNPESFVFVRHPDTNALYLVLSKTRLYTSILLPNQQKPRTATPASPSAKPAGKISPLTQMPGSPSPPPASHSLQPTPLYSPSRPHPSRT